VRSWQMRSELTINEHAGVGKLSHDGSGPTLRTSPNKTPLNEIIISQIHLDGSFLKSVKEISS
jgi:4-hydroxy-3-methylbut-2-en-1-yl diphosphate synthase IspG/GcpE